jgi:glycosyltransferase involved in cell wall biosynthesis
LHIYLDASIGGGAELTRETLISALTAHGHDVVGVGTSSARGMTQEISGGVRRWSVGLANVYWPLKDKVQPGWRTKLWHLLDVYNPLMRRRLGRILDIEKPDVVLAHNLPGWSVAALSAIRRRQIPVVQVLHDHYNICVNSMMFRVGRNCIGQCADCRVMRLPHRVLTNKVNAVVGISKYILDRHIEHGVFEKVPIRRVIHNVRSAERLGVQDAPALRAAAMAAREEIDIRFGFIGSLVPSKGIEQLISAFAKLGDLRAELWVAGIGKPEYLNLLKAKAEGAGVKFMGQMKQAEFFASIDVLVVPSLWQEPLGMVVAESFAFGVPVIGARRGGIPEMITDGQNGSIFEPDKEGELESAMQRYVTNPKIIHAMAANALIAGAKFLNTNDWYCRYMAAINDACGQNA